MPLAEYFWGIFSATVVVETAEKQRQKWKVCDCPPVFTLRKKSSKNEVWRHVMRRTRELLTWIPTLKTICLVINAEKENPGFYRVCRLPYMTMCQPLVCGQYTSVSITHLGAWASLRQSSSSTKESWKRTNLPVEGANWEDEKNVVAEMPRNEQRLKRVVCLCSSHFQFWGRLCSSFCADTSGTDSQIFVGGWVCNVIP